MELKDVRHPVDAQHCLHNGIRSMELKGGVYANLAKIVSPCPMNPFNGIESHVLHRAHGNVCVRIHESVQWN